MLRTLEIAISQMSGVLGFNEVVEAYIKTDNRPVTNSTHFNIESYITLEEMNLAKGALLLNDDFECVGLVTVFKAHDAHAAMNYVYCDSLFCLPEYRRQGGGKMLIDKAVEMARELGVKGLFLSAPYGSRLAKVYERLYQPTDVLFWKEV